MEVDNETDETLTLHYLTVDVDYTPPPAPDFTVTDLRFSGSPTYDEVMTVSADIQNVGDQAYLGNVEAQLFIDGVYEESSYLTAGLLAGQSWTERFTFRVFAQGDTTAEVRILPIPGERSTSNNSRTESFDVAYGDLTMTDIRFSGDPSVGELMTVEVDVENIGTGNYIEYTELHLYVNGEYQAKSVLTLGLLAGQSKQENFTYRVVEGGEHDVEVRIVDTEGEPTGNNTITGSFVPKQHDLVMADIRVDGALVAGQEITIEGYVTNVSDDGTLDAFDVVFYVDDREIGRETADFGLLAGTTTEQSIDYTLPTNFSGALTIRAEIEGIAQDADYSNHARTETFGSGGTKIGDRLEEIQLAAHMARAVYGDLAIAEDDRGAEDDNGLDDAYDDYFSDLGWLVLTADNADFASYFSGDSDTRFTSGGLFEGRYEDGDPWEAQALLTMGTDSEGKGTLVLGFRGTDDVGESLDGQAFAGDGQYKYYNALRPLIEGAIAFANDSSNGVEKLIVTGHSLGGAMVDIFTAVDAQHVSSRVELHAIALASAGIDPNTLTDSAFFNGFDAEYDRSVASETAFSIDLVAPTHYVGLSHLSDGVTYPERVVFVPGSGLVPNAVLVGNELFDNAVLPMNVPWLNNTDKDSGDTFFRHGFGAQHDQGLYWANLQALTSDPLAPFIDGHGLIFGTAAYTDVPDLGGASLSVFDDYIRHGVSGDDDNLSGISSGRNADFVLGLSGADRISGNDGNDLLSGGSGNDTLTGGNGNDRLHGGLGDDNLRGDDGNDMLEGADGADTLNGGEGDDTIIGGETEADLRDVVFGGAGNDSIDGNYGNDLLYGMDGNDTISGGFGADELQGQDGNDVITGSAFSDLVFGGAGDDFVNGGFGFDRINGGSGADKFFHAGVKGHGSDWLQDYNALEGDVLVFGDASATADDFQINYAHTTNPTGERSGDDTVQEAFVIYKPTGQIIWALVDGGAQGSIHIEIGGDVFDLLT